MATASRNWLLNAVRNWTVLPQVKAALVSAAKQSRGPGRGFDIPRKDTEDAERGAILVKALEEVLRDNPEMQVLISPKHLTLCYRSDFATAASAALREQLEQGGFLARGGQPHELPIGEGPVNGAADPEDL